MNPPPVNLAQGVCHWDPPPAALRQMESLREPTNHKYGPALGLPALREALVAKLEEENGLDMTGQEVTVETPNRSRLSCMLPSYRVEQGPQTRQCH